MNMHITKMLFSTNWRLKTQKQKKRSSAAQLHDGFLLLFCT